MGWGGGRGLGGGGEGATASVVPTAFSVITSKKHASDLNIPFFFFFFFVIIVAYVE